MFALLLFFGNILTQKAAGQSYDYNKLHFRQFNVLQGLPSDACTKIYKDSYGFLWISTYYGISIFNGSKFTSLPVYSAKHNYYLADFPYTFLQLNKDSMLISCSDGLYIFRYRDNNVSKVQGQPVLSSRARIIILGFNSTQTGVLVRMGSSIYSFDTLLKQKASFKCENESSEISVDNEYSCPLYFYYTSTSHLIALNTETGRKDTVLYLPAEKGGIVVNCQSATQYIVATSTSILKIDLTRKNSVQTLALPLPGPGLAFIPLCLKKDPRGNYWIGGRANLFIYYPATNSISVANTLFSDSVSNKAIIVNDVLIDKDGMFISTINNGLLKYDDQYTNFENYDLPAGLNSSVYSIAVQGNRLMAVPNTGGLLSFRLGEPQDKYERYDILHTYGDITEIENLNTEHIWAIFREGFRLGIVNLKNFELLPIRFSVDSIAEAHFKKINNKFPRIDLQPIIKKVSGNLFYYSVRNYLFCVKGNLQKGFTFSLADSIPSPSYICAIAESSSKEIIVGTNNLELFSLQGNRLVKRVSPNYAAPLPVKSLYTDTAGNVYALTINGLYIFDRQYHLKQHLTGPDLKLLNNILYGGVIDKNGMLWMSANEGIIAYDTKRGSIYNFASARLLHSREFNSRSVYIDSAGVIYFGGSNGITAVHTNLFSSGHADTKLYFEKINNFDSVLLYGMMPGSFTAANTFAYNKNTFNFSIGNIAYRQLEDANYKYFLEGFDKSWSPSSDNRTISYTNLPPGEYTFRVKQAYSDNTPGAEISYAFRINKPFWKTAWFFVLMFISGATLLGFIITYVMDKKLEKQRIKVTKELALKTERERISQELHDDLGSGLTSIRLLAKSVIAKQQAESNISGMLNNIGKISGELIDQMSEIIWLMNNIDDTINGLLAHLRIYMADYLNRTGFKLRLHFENQIKTDYYINAVQRRNILLVVKEAFHNAVKHSDANDFSIICNADIKMLSIIICDNGKGLPEHITLNGNGLNNIRKRIQALNGEVSFESTNGTRILIKIPKDKKTK